MESRTKNSARNMLVSLIMQTVTILLSFACRTVFARLLETEYLGLSGLFSNIISVLSLSELGIGSVIIIHLYKPLSDNNEDMICRLMNFYRKAYTAVGLFVIGAGLALAPFLDVLVKSDADIPHLKLYFILFVLQSATSYFFAYKQSLLTASQKEYICTIVRHVFGIIMNGLQILFLLLTKQYITYLLVAIVTNLGTNLVISIIADRKFPYIKSSHHLMLDKAKTKSMYRDVSSMMLHKVGNTVISSTDNILISSMIGVIYTGLYSNYLLIINSISQLISIALNAVSASVGDYNARKSAEERYELFDSMQLISTWVFGMSAICFASLFQPTISIWLGQEFLLSFDIVLVISLNFYINGILRVPATFSDVNGIYRKTKFKPILMAAVNLAASIILLRHFGLLGVFLGTLISYLTVGVWVDPLYLYKEVFLLPAHRYFLGAMRNFLVISTVGIITYLATVLMPHYLLKLIVAPLLSNGLLLVCYGRTNAFRFVLTRVAALLKIKLKREKQEWRT